MALTINVNAAYATIAHADDYLENNANWYSAEEEDKEEALLWARYWIDYRFDCIDSLSTIPDELIYANSILAADYIDNPTAFKPQVTVIKKAIQAGSVKTFKQYANDSRVVPPSTRMARTILRRIAGEIYQNRFVR